MLLSAVYSVGSSTIIERRTAGASAAFKLETTHSEGKLLASGHLEDALRIHGEIQRRLQGEYGLSREEAALWTLQIMTDALKEANSHISVDVSINAYREQQALRIEIDAPDQGGNGNGLPNPMTHNSKA